MHLTQLIRSQLKQRRSVETYAPDIEYQQASRSGTVTSLRAAIFPGDSHEFCGSSNYWCYVRVERRDLQWIYSWSFTGTDRDPYTPIT